MVFDNLNLDAYKSELRIINDNYAKLNITRLRLPEANLFGYVVIISKDETLSLGLSVKEDRTTAFECALYESLHEFISKLTQKNTLQSDNNFQVIKALSLCKKPLPTNLAHYKYPIEFLGIVNKIISPKSSLLTVAISHSDQLYSLNNSSQIDTNDDRVQIFLNTKLI